MSSEVECTNVRWTDSTYKEVVADFRIDIGLTLHNTAVSNIGQTPLANGSTFVELKGIGPKDVAQFEKLYDQINSQVITLLNYLLSTEGPVN